MSTNQKTPSWFNAPAWADYLGRIGRNKRWVWYDAQGYKYADRPNGERYLFKYSWNFSKLDIEFDSYRPDFSEGQQKNRAARVAIEQAKVAPWLNEQENDTMPEDDKITSTFIINEAVRVTRLIKFTDEGTVKVQNLTKRVWRRWIKDDEDDQWRKQHFFLTDMDVTKDEVIDAGDRP